MKESEYMTVSALAKMRCAFSVLRDAVGYSDEEIDAEIRKIATRVQAVCIKLEKRMPEVEEG